MVKIAPSCKIQGTVTVSHQQSAKVKSSLPQLPLPALPHPRLIQIMTDNEYGYPCHITPGVEVVSQGLLIGWLFGAKRSEVPGTSTNMAKSFIFTPRKG